MEQASTAASRALARSNESTVQPPSGRTSSEAVSKGQRVWSAMAELYGPAFAAAYGDVPSPIWLAAISGLTEADLGRGFTTLAKQPREFPPNLTQFVDACRPSTSSPRFLGTPTTPAEMRRLEKPRASRDVADRYLARMRGRLAQ